MLVKFQVSEAMAIMTDQAIEFPQKCISSKCGKRLYGPVAFCPFCGVDQVNSEKQNIVVIKETPPPIQKKEFSPPESSEIQSSKETAKKQTLPPIQNKEFPPPEPSEIISPKETAEERRKEKLKKPPFKPISILVLASFLVIAGLFGFLYLRPKGNPPDQSYKTSSPTSSVLNSAKDPKNEAAHSLALEALRLGTEISVPISKLTNLEKVLIAAQKLLDISPRYKEQVINAEKSLRSAKEKIDKGLMSYIETVLKLSSYSTKQVDYAISILRNSDHTPRDQIVAELLQKHIDSLKHKGVPDPTLWLNHFKNRFSTFVD
jgi:hypothetical protein